MNLLDYRPGTSAVHRAPLGPKYAVLLVMTLVLVAWRLPVVVSVALVAAPVPRWLSPAV